jgi:hypothetical protein
VPSFIRVDAASCRAGLASPRREALTLGQASCPASLRVTAGNSPRLSLAALVTTKPGQRPRLIYRTHTGRRHRVGRREDFTEADYARLDAAH